jgi:hypothetical protein
MVLRTRVKAVINSVVFAILLSSSLTYAGSLLVSWDDVPDSRVAGYKIKYGTQSNSYSNSVNVGQVTSYVLGNLTDGATYYFVVVAYDSTSAEGAPSAEASGTVLTTSNVAATSTSSGSAVISWQTNKVSDSQVSYGTSLPYSSTTSVDPALVTNHSQTLTGLAPSTTYQFQVRSKDEGGSISTSGNYTFTTPPEVSISTLSPSSGPTGVDVVISGKGFGSSQGSSAVTFSGVTAPIKSWGGSSITATCPEGARSGSVVVTVNQVKSNEVTFKVNGKLAPPGRIRVKG